MMVLDNLIEKGVSRGVIILSLILTGTIDSRIIEWKPS